MRTAIGFLLLPVVSILSGLPIVAAALEVDDFWSSVEGDIRVVEGRVYKGDSLTRVSILVFTTTGQTTCGENDCIGYSMRSRPADSTDTDDEQHVFIYQVLTREYTCSWGVGWEPDERIPLGCTYRDLEGPVNKGKRWSFSDSLPIHEQQFRPPPAVTYVSEIVEAGVQTQVGDEVHDGCIKVVTTGTAEPSQPIVCHDGQSSLVVSKIVKDRVLCPNIGSVLENITETHRKATDRSSVCTSFASEHRATDFRRSDGG